MDQNCNLEFPKFPKFFSEISENFRKLRSSFNYLLLTNAVKAAEFENLVLTEIIRGKISEI